MQLANVQTKSDTAAGENTYTVDEQNINAKEEFAAVDGTESDENVKVKSVASRETLFEKDAFKSGCIC